MYCICVQLICLFVEQEFSSCHTHCTNIIKPFWYTNGSGSLTLLLTLFCQQIHNSSMYNHITGNSSFLHSDIIQCIWT